MTLSGVGDLLGVAALRGDSEHALSGTSGGCVTAAMLTGVEDCRSENTESGGTDKGGNHQSLVTLTRTCFDTIGYLEHRT